MKKFGIIYLEKVKFCIIHDLVIYPREILAYLHRMTSMSVYNDNIPNSQKFEALLKFIIYLFLPKALLNTSAVFINK